MKNEKNIGLCIAIVLILIGGFLLREYRTIDVFTSNDEMDPIFHVMKTLTLEWNKENVLSLSSKNPVARLIVYPVSVGGTNTVLAWGLFGNWILHIPIDEKFWLFPFIMMGVLSILFVYLTIKRIKNGTSALIAAVLLCVLPIHIALSRFIVQMMPGFFFHSLFVLLYVYFFETKKKRYLIASSVVLCLYIVSHNEFLGTLPFILYFPMVYCKREMKDIVRGVCKTVLDWRFFALPLATIIGLVAVHFMVVLTNGISCYDIIGHTFSGSKTGLGFYLIEVLPIIESNIGIVLSLLLVVSLYFGIMDTVKLKKEASIFVLGFFYTLPFIILVPVNATGVWGHISHGLIWWVAYVGLLLPDLYNRLTNKITGRDRLKQAIGILLLALLLIATLAESSIYVYRQLLTKDYTDSASPFVNGVYKPDNGVKAAGYWIRQNTPESAIILSDASGGGGIEPPVGSYYFNRKTLGMKDATLEQAYGYISDKISQVDAIIIDPKNIGSLKKVMTDANQTFYKAATISDSGKELLYIFSKNDLGYSQYDICSTNRLYDEEYTSLDDYQNKVFIAEEGEQQGYFKEKCSKTKLHQLYVKLGLIK